MDKPPTGQEMKSLRLHLRDCHLRGWQQPCSDPEAHARAVQVFGPLTSAVAVADEPHE